MGPRALESAELAANLIVEFDRVVGIWLHLDMRTIASNDATRLEA